MWVLEHNMATLSLTRRMASLCLRCLTTSWSSLPTFLATCLPSILMESRAAGCQPPRVSTARGRKVMPSLAHLSSSPHISYISPYGRDPLHSLPPGRLLSPVLPAVGSLL